MYGEYFRLGGFMMWPLLVCSVLFTALVIERCWTLIIKRRLFKKINVQGNAHNFEFFKSIPPAIGLLGTVIGIVQCFGLTNGTITAETAAAGLGVACFTTIAGLGISISAMVAEYFFGWFNKDSLDQ